MFQPAFETSERLVGLFMDSPRVDGFEHTATQQATERDTYCLHCITDTIDFVRPKNISSGSSV